MSFSLLMEACETGNSYNGLHMGARVSSIFVIMFTSGLGAFFPVLASQYSFIKMPSWCFFIAKYFGSGVIIATSFIHLLSPADDSLSNACLGNPFDVYPMAFGICLITLMVMFFLELIAYRWIESKIGGGDINAPHSHSHFGDTKLYTKSSSSGGANPNPNSHSHSHSHNHHGDFDVESLEDCELQELRDEDFTFTKKAPSVDSDSSLSTDLEASIDSNSMDFEFAGQLLNVFVLEFGIIFHSVFIGLTLACAGDEFISLYIVLVFHQMFEGLGLGTRIASVDWKLSNRTKWTPWLLCLAFTLTTPIAIAIGLGVRESYPPNSKRALITNGVFDSISAGILIYTGLIELMAHEFLFGDEFKGEGGFKKMLYAYLIMVVGAGVMALLGRWA